jgi:tyrosine-protein kinase Etk/Wzc
MSQTHLQDPDYKSETGIPHGGLTLLDLIGSLVKHKILIVGTTFGLALLTVGVLGMTIILPATSRWNILPNKFKPTAKVLIQESGSGSSLSSLLGQGGLGSLSGLLGGAGMSGSATSGNLAQALLRGRVIQDGVTAKFDFIGRYKLTKNAKSAARKIFKGSLKTKYDDLSGILEIGYEDIDKEFATRIVNDVTERLQEQFGAITIDKVVEKKLYLEKALASQQAYADAAASRLGAFKNKYGVYDLPSQTQANITALANVQSQLRSKQMDLDLQRKYIPESDTRIVMLKDQINQIQGEIDRIKSGTDSSSIGTLPLSKMVGLASEYASLQTDVQVQQAILLAMKQQYETAKLQVQDTSSTFQVLESAEVPEERSSPRRSLIVVVVTFVAFLLSFLIASVKDYIQRADQDPDERKKLSMIRENLRFRKRQSLGSQDE